MNSSSPEPHSVRITSGGKIKSWVKFALEFFEKEENSNKPLVFHTLPSTTSSSEQDPSASNPPVNTSNVVNTIPRLVSVVEIIKREYIKLLELKHSTRLIGLHQYNQIGILEDLGIIEASPAEGTEDMQRQLELSMALEGKNFPKQKQTPYMKITLCCSEVPEFVANGAT
ncbi:hypothetical protein E1B28_010143 [Marasmius oreades]|nr:uncharacterized protein E1B28_010143 [Marasmius oreades]KAG7091088.1 hypothetical protein E1B28_010143 [Marasmius oreades]